MWQAKVRRVVWGDGFEREVWAGWIKNWINGEKLNTAVSSHVRSLVVLIVNAVIRCSRNNKR